MNATILIIDDNKRVFDSLKPNLQHFGMKAVYAKSGSEAEMQLQINTVDAILLDIMLGRESGIDVLKQLKKFHSSTPVVMVTGFASIDTAVESMKLGAFDYVKKPLDFEQLIKVVEKAIERKHPSGKDSPNPNHTSKSSEPISYESRKLRAVFAQAKKLADTNIPILIVGENGSGKEVLADYIHSKSKRSSLKMLKINCAAFPDTLLDNELFGHERGAYTGADSSFKGIFERADGSTLFLDEIGDMLLSIQAKILRVLQNNEIRRIGGSKTLKVDMRFIAATNKNLLDLMERSLFRRDLFYRLNTAMLHMPPLRERREDIPGLVNCFIKEFSETNRKEVDGLDDTVWNLFNSYSWPGNVRELKNTLHYATALAVGRIIIPSDLPPLFNNMFLNEGLANDGLDLTEKNLIESTLRKCLYNKKKTAEMLNISRKTLYARIARHGIDL